MGDSQTFQFFWRESILAFLSGSSCGIMWYFAQSRV